MTVPSPDEHRDRRDVPRVLVTGGAGFLGSHVARHCLELGMEVAVLDDLSGGFEDQVPAGAIFHQASICDVEYVKVLFDVGKFDYVYHLAAYAAEGLSHFVRRFNYENNVIGSVNLINEAVRHDVRRFVFTSSIAVYGTAKTPFQESYTPAPEDPYGIAKYAVEMDLRAAAEMFGLEYTIFRPHNIYGPHQNLGDRYRNVVGIFMRQAMAGKPFSVFGDGRQRRAFTYVSDVAPHIARAATLPTARNEIFNVGGDTEYSVLELADAVAKEFNVVSQIQHLPVRHEVQNAWSDHTKFLQVFDRKPKVPLATGLRLMAAWARNTGVRMEEKRLVEVIKNLPPSWQ